KGIARGRSVVAVQYADGILFASENPSQALHKVSEIYDRIAFAAVGRYNEFENLRIAGVRLADMRGYAYDRRDVTGRGLANAYAQTLGTIFSSGGEKPYEVELFVAEVGDSVEGDSIYRLTYDGQVADEHGYAVMGGLAEPATAYLKEHYRSGTDLETVIRLAVQALGQADNSGETRVIPAANLEVAVLDRTRSQQRKFKRLAAGQLGRILGTGGPGDGSGGGPGNGNGSDGGGHPSTDPSGPDSPADPTDTAGGSVPPLEDPVSGEPERPDEPPVAPPVS
ncbi:MAG TPA: proteasome subunit alpha, partial [Nocardioidaceae bacterium]|nr:proteasome subunit alpha [Nocardioidaceae bacterium]